MLNLTNPIGLIRPETIEFGSGTVSAAGRWAKARGLARVMGHRHGVERVREVLGRHF